MDMNKEELLSELEAEMKHFFCRGIKDDFSRFEMENAVETFVKKEAARYSLEELMEKFATIEDAFKLFIEYLKGKGMAGTKLADYYRKSG